MPQSLDCLLAHIVFSVKNRAPLLLSEIRPKLFAYADAIVRADGAVCLTAGGVEDHIHFAVRLSRSRSVAALVREVKTGTSRWLKTQAESLEGFSWQKGYGAFSVSPSHQRALRIYIDGQVEHHRTVSFQDEFRRILKKNGIEGDERHMWD